MLTTAMNILLALTALFYLIFVVKRDLQMLQQNSYRNERYIKWLKQSDESLKPNRLFCCVIVVLCISGFAQFDWFNYVKGLVSIVFVILAVSLIKRKYKHSLVFTKRVWRLFITEIALIVITGVLFSIIEQSIFALVIWPIFMIMISSGVTIAVNWLLKPVENAINQRYYNDAKRLLEQMSDMKIIGITGSYGKTSTKHYLNRILSEHFSVLMTPGSFNTPMGVIRTVREMMQPYNEVFIVEMGAKNIGDIKEICDLVHPSMGIITAVGPQHLESFKTIENVQRTKFELADALPADGYVVVNNDFPYVANRNVDNVAVSRYTVEDVEGSDYHAEDIQYSAAGTTFRILGKDVDIELSTKLVGECNISNLIAATLIAIKLGVPVDKIKYAVSKIAQVEHRLNIKRTPAGVTIIDDAFNSNPDGSRMALNVLANMKGGKRIVITPGMIELGTQQAFYNEKFGEHIAETSDVAIIVGEYNREAILKGIKSKEMPEENVHPVNTFNDAQALLATIAMVGDTVLYENDLPDTFK